MATSVTIGANSYNIPATGERSWGDEVSNILIDLANQADKIATTAIPLTTSNLTITDATGVYGITSNFLTGNGDAASDGFIRMAHWNPAGTPVTADTVNTSIAWRNTSNDGDLELQPKNSSDTILQYAGVDLADVSSAQTITTKTLDADNNTISNLETDNLKAGVLITATDLTGAADTNIPSSLAVKTYIDDATAAGNEFTELTDTPADYTAAAGKVLAVNSTPDGVEFVDITTYQTALEGVLDHDQLQGFVAAEHIDWSITGAEDVNVDRITASAVTQHVGSIDHDSLLNYVADQHVAHSGVTISGTANKGISGGGDITVSRELELDIAGLAVPAGDIQATDNLAIDRSGTPGKYSFSHIESKLTHDSLNGVTANDHVDHSTISVQGAATGGISTTGGTIDANVELSLDVNNLTAEATSDGATDYVAVYDASAGAMRKALLQNLDISGAGVTTIGTIDSQTVAANGAVISGTSLYMQTADDANPGLVSREEAHSVSLNGTFTGGTLKLVKVGKQVTISLVTPNYAGSAATVTSATSLIPTNFLPPANLRLWGFQETNYIRTIRVNTDGSVAVANVNSSLGGASITAPSGSVLMASYHVD